MDLPSLVRASEAYHDARVRLNAVHQATMRGRATHLDLALAVQEFARAEARLKQLLGGVDIRPTMSGAGRLRCN